MTNTAKRIIIPAQSGVFRTIFLYTGQGDATLHVIPDGTNYRYVLLDCDHDYDPGEINLVKMFKALFEGMNRGLDVYINTHPHNDHIGGIREIYDAIGIKEVWHSNHKPGRKHKKKYEDLYYVIKKVGKENEFHLKGTNKLNKVRTVENVGVINRLGDVDYQVLSPATHLCEEIDDAGAEERDRRIHELCGVIRFIYGSNQKSILMTGDSDVATWRDHIMYHENVLSSLVLHASHHGADTFFCEKDKEPYFDHMDAIEPNFVVVSAPKQKDSQYGHPHDFAMGIYKKYAGSDGVYHLGEKPYSVIVDIHRDGNYSIRKDEDLIKAYSDSEDGNKDGGNNKALVGFTPRQEVSQPRKGERFA